MTAIKSKVILGAGCAINKDMYYIASTFDELEETEDGTYSRMFIYQNQTNEKWFQHDLPNWRVMSTCFPAPAADGIRKVYALSEQGDVECYSKLGATFEKISDAGLSLNGANHGYVTCIREIGQHLYVCGYGGQVYRREESGWVRYDNQLLHAPIAAIDSEDPAQFLELISRQVHGIIGLTDINGAGESSIYVVGLNGFLSHFNGFGWQNLDKVTASHLNSIFIESDENVWVAGADGILLNGDILRGFRVFVNESFPTDFYSITKFQGMIYVGASDGIYGIDNSIIRRLPESDMLDLSPVSHVEAKDGVLWALTERKLARFDGATWEIFENPHNV